MTRADEADDASADEATADGGPRLVGYGPSVDEDSRVLVLGSMPSARSLELVEYYGHAQNRFWPFMQELFGIARELPHVERLARLRAAGVALWDVVHACRRVTSADARIRDVEVNDFASLFARYPKIGHVFCNGGKAHELWTRRVARDLERALSRSLPCTRLPSTSPANASQSPRDKLRAWTALRDVLDATGQRAPGES